MAARVRPRVPVRVYLTEWREHFNLTQEEVSGRVGAADNVASRWELWLKEPQNQNARQPNLESLVAFAEALGIPVENLFRPPTGLRSLDAIVARAAPELQ